MRLKGNQKGFTLVEIAIVMVIIGLLMGGVLKGKSMIENAKIKNLVNQHDGLLAAIYSYQDKFKALPGDDPQADVHVGGDNGNGNGQITEYFDAPAHLALGEFIKGSYNGTSDVMRHTYGGPVYIYYQTIASKTGNLIRFDGLTAEVAQALDSQIDDGVYDTGSVRASAAYTAGTTIARTGCYL